LRLCAYGPAAFFPPREDCYVFIIDLAALTGKKAVNAISVVNHIALPRPDATFHFYHRHNSGMKRFREWSRIKAIS